MGESLLPISMGPLEPGTLDESVMAVSRALRVSDWALAVGSEDMFIRWLGGGQILRTQRILSGM